MVQGRARGIGREPTAPVRALQELLGVPVHILLDVDADNLGEVLEAVAGELVEGTVLREQGVAEGYVQAVQESLRRQAGASPQEMDAGVAILHDPLRGVRGPPIQVLVRTARPLPLTDRHGQQVQFLWVLLSSEASHPHLGAAAEFVRLMHQPMFLDAMTAADTPDALVRNYERILDAKLHFEHIPPELRATGRLFGGVAADLRRRLPWWVDDFRAGFNLKVLASVLFMYFACLAPAVAFGGLMYVLTDGQIGAVETLLASAVCGVLWALFAGQPLPIVGATGPNVIFTGMLFALCVRFDVPFLPTVAWTGLWTGLFLIVLAAVDASSLIRFFTRFTDEIFAGLIAVIYIVEAVTDLVSAFSDPSRADDTALLTLLLALGTFGVAMFLSRFRRSPYLRPRVREILSDFGPAIALATMTLVAVSMHRVELVTMAVPEAFAPTMERSWFVNPLDAPRWVWFASALPAMLLTILIWVNQNITARLANNPDYRLVKGSSYHYDILVMGVLVGLMGLFGLPWVVGGVVRSLNHVKSLAVLDEAGRITGVVENRISNLGISALMGLSLLFLPVLAHVPMAVLFGLFLFMGFGTVAGNQFLERVTLWVMDPDRYPATHYLRAVPTRVVHAYTAIQVACLGVLWVVKVSPLGILFPFFVAMLVPVRMALPRLFRPEHLGLLDGAEVLAEEPLREVA